MVSIIVNQEIFISIVFVVDIVLTANNTTQFGNFAVMWLNFDIFKCAVPKTINISLVSCISPNYTQVDDISCLEETIFEFQESTCQTTSMTMVDIIILTRRIIVLKTTFLLE